MTGSRILAPEDAAVKHLRHGRRNSERENVIVPSPLAGEGMKAFPKTLLGEGHLCWVRGAHGKPCLGLPLTHHDSLNRFHALSRKGRGRTKTRLVAGQPSMREKSATARVASRISLSRRSRFSRTDLASSVPVTLTVTLSKKASTCGRSFAMALMAAAKSSLATAA